MRALALDFQRDGKPLPWPGLLLLATALAGLVALAGYHRDLAERNAVWEARVERIERLSSGRARAARPLDEKATRTQILEVQQANQVLRQLGLPWNALFKALETSAGDGVALLSMEPDTRKGTVSISGEAKDLDAMLDFIRRLGTRDVFTSVFLRNHQVQQQDPQRPVRFTLVAVWKGALP